MRLYNFKAPSLRQAMTLVRRELGEDAKIVSTQTIAPGREVRIVAARHQDTQDPRLGRVALAPDQRSEHVLGALLLHGVPLSLADRLAQAAAGMAPKTPVAALAGALGIDFSFRPMDMTADSQRLILVGPPGSGKTLALVKLAVRALMAKRSVQILTTDLKRAGAVEQLTAFARVMGQEVFITDTADEMAQFMARTPKRTIVLVDSPGVNHRSRTEMDGLIDFVKAAPVEPVLVMAAGTDALEAAEMAVAFGAAGAERLLVTRMDAAGRLGAILAMLESSGLALAGITGSADPSEGFAPAGPADLADLLFGESLGLSNDLPARKAPPAEAGYRAAALRDPLMNVALPAER